MSTTQLQIALSEPIDPAGVELLREHAEVWEYASLNELLQARAQLRTDAIVVRSVNVSADSMDLLPGLRVIGRHGAGTDNIDIPGAKARGIEVVNTPRSNSQSVAEYVIGVSYFLLKRMGENSRALLNGAFSAEEGSLPGQVQRLGLTGKDLSACTIGVVGFGAIGREVARLARAHGMQVCFFDPYVDLDLERDGTIRRMDDLDELLALSDVVTIHVPGEPGAPPLFGKARISKMRKGSILVNAARGSLVCLDAVKASLQSGQLMACAIDVFEVEPPLLDPDLVNNPGVLLTPHMAAMTDDSLIRMSRDVARFTLEALGVRQDS